jgi:hypothetical protein
MNPKDAHAQIAGRLQLTPPVRIAPVSIPSLTQRSSPRRDWAEVTRVGGNCTGSPGSCRVSR